jgi:hypothetical protein
MAAGHGDVTWEECRPAAWRAAVPLTLLDNLYVYGRPEGPMTEQSPLHPCSRKCTAWLTDGT